MTDASEKGGDGSAAIPPYIPFQTLLTFLKQMKTDNLPPQIDKSVLTKFSGGTQNQLRAALKALGLMDDNKPTLELESLVDAYETSGFEAALGGLLRRSYPYVFAIDLTTATRTMFADAFKATGAREDVSRKCRTFFLHAAKRAGVPLGPRILTGSVPRAATNGNAKRRPKAAKVEEEARGEGSPRPPPPPRDDAPVSDKALEYKLVDLMKEDEIEDGEREAIWTLIQYLTRKAKRSNTKAAAGT